MKPQYEYVGQAIPSKYFQRLVEDSKGASTDRLDLFRPIKRKVPMIKPLANRVVVEVQAPEEQTSGGILLAENTRKAPNVGTVVAVGAGTFIDKEGIIVPPEVSVGNKVVFVQGAGVKTKIDGAEYLVMPETEIVAIYE